MDHVKQFEMPLILAGGLTPANVQTAISVVKPYAIDVNSGVEDHPGKKSFVRMKALMKAVEEINRGGTEND
jgi:phosphoribosylanthranilate isomerase